MRYHKHMYRKAFIIGTLAFAVVLAGFFLQTGTTLQGSLLGAGDTPTRIKALADTDENKVLTAKELRSALVSIIGGVAVNNAAYDVNKDSMISRQDIGDAVIAMRALLSAVCGNGTLDAGEECDDGNALDVDACNNICALTFCGDGTCQINEGAYGCDPTPELPDICSGYRFCPEDCSAE